MTEIVAEVEGRRVKLTNLDKVLYPVTGTTKGEVLNYYAQVAPVMLPHLADRAVTRIRWPHGVQGESFFEKNVPNGAPSWLRTHAVPTTGSRSGADRPGEIVFPVIDGVAALTYLVNLASLELHVHQWTVDERGEVHPPDRLVIDLDPGEPAGLMQCCEVALLVREALAERGLHARPVTSGSKGLHLYADLPGTEQEGLDSDGTTALAKEVAEQLQAESPQAVTATMTKSRRAGKVFLDWSQNAGSKTTVSPYSLRGTEKPTVATPVTWEEVEEGADDAFGLRQFRLEEVLERVSENGDFFGSA